MKIFIGPIQFNHLVTNGAVDSNFLISSKVDLDMNYLIDELRSLEKQNKILKSALEFYADDSQYSPVVEEEDTLVCWNTYNSSKIAKEALKEIGDL